MAILLICWLQLIAGYAPMSHEMVNQALRLAKVTKADTVYDLGSGDGRVVIAAAREYGARGVGIEFDPKLCHQSQAKVSDLVLKSKVRIICGDIRKQDLRKATVIVMYLELDSIQVLEPQLGKLKRVRIVSNSMQPKWKATTFSHGFWLYER